MWQSHAFAGALSVAGPVPLELGNAICANIPNVVRVTKARRVSGIVGVGD
jgi:hypothetical protein